jgi:preprotein translocase subunit SecB
MDKELLQEAIDSLNVKDVYIFRANSFLMPGVDPKYDNSFKNLLVSFKHEVVSSEIVEISTGDTKKVNLFRIYIDLGVRWKMLDEETEETFEKNTAVLIETTFIAEYEMVHEVTEEALKEFALHNASYHVWPYWREYLANQCDRMNLPKITIPIIQLASNRDANSSSK